MRVAHGLKHHRAGAIEAGLSLERLDDFVASGLVPSSTAVPIASFDSVLELSIPGGTDPDWLIDRLDGLVDRLGPAVDPSCSAAVLGPGPSDLRRSRPGAAVLLPVPVALRSATTSSLIPG